jgi:hypothetical protein
VDPGQEARRVVDELSRSAWAFAALTAALEAGPLEAQGRSGKGAIPAMVQAIRQVPELAARLGQPWAASWTWGGVVAIELCRAFPALRVVGLEPAPAPLARARRNVAAAQLADRIELRQQGVQALQDTEAFDLAYVAQVFIPDGVFAAGLARVWRALRPGAG